VNRVVIVPQIFAEVAAIAGFALVGARRLDLEGRTDRPGDHVPPYKAIFVWGIYDYLTPRTGAAAQAEV
jgi:hypothetical protein